MAFDPDAFLLEEDEEEIIPQQPTQTLPQSTGFDPDAFLTEEEEPEFAQPAPAAQPAYQYDPSGFRRKKPVSPETQKEIGTLEGIANAARNAFDSSRQSLDIVGDVTPEEAKNIAKIEFDKQSRKIAPGYDEYQKAEGFDAVLAFAKNPIEVTSNIVAEGLAGSLPALGAGLAAGGVGAAAGSVVPVVGTAAGFTAGQVAGTFAGSLATEYGSKILEEMQEGGVDLTKPESIQGFFENEEAVAKARDKAISRGIPVAAFDAISAGIGGKLGRVIGKQFLTKTGEAAAELGVQAGLGGGGEVAGALAAGEPIEGKAVFGEIIGEAGPGAAEIITGRMADRAARVKAEEDAKIKAAAQLSDNLEQNSAPLTAAVVKSTTATTIEQDKLAAQLEEQLDADEIEKRVSGQLAVTKKPTAVAQKPMSKDEFKAIYSQVAPEELDAAEAGFTQQAVTDATEGGRISAQNALEAIKEVKATVTPPAPPVEPTITPAVTPAVPTAQPPTPDATQEIIQPEGVRQEPQDRVEGETPDETIARNRIFGAARGQEEGQVVPTPEPIISEIPTTSELVGAEPTQPTIREIPKISPIVGSEPSAIVEQEPIAPVTTIPVTEAVTPAEAPAITPAPVAETPAVTEAPAAEVAPVQRDITKPEQMTPEERGTQGHKLVIEQARQDFELAKTGQTFGFSGGQTYKSKAAAIKDTKSTFEQVSQPTEADIKRGASDHYGEINRAISDSNPVSAAAVDTYDITLPEGYTKQGDLYVYQPAVSETIAPAAEPTGISVGNRIKLGKSPQTYTIEEVIPQSATERDLGEQYYSVKNERTGETQVVEARDLKQVKGKGARKIAADQYPTIGININDKTQNFTDQILSGEKTIETRDTDSLRRYVGQRIGIVRTGKGKATLVGYADIGEPIVYNNANEFRADQDKHLVEERSKFDIKSGEKKYGYPLTNIQSIDPIEIPPNLSNWYSARFIPQPTSPDIRRQAIDTTPEGILTTPPDQQYTFNEVFDVAYDMFGGEIPEGFTIVNDSTDKDFEFKAAYIPESGEIIVNLAYLNKSDDIRDTITHELGHYIFGDPEFRAAFDQFIASLSPEARAELDAYVETAYNKETGEIRLEEKMVRAFVDQFINEEQAPAWRSMLDAIKRFLNKLGFKFNISDRDAISVFTAALDRYKAGEAISREGGARKIIDDLTAMDAEYLAAVERGDMETAQRMVDEAAKKAGYDSENLLFHGTTHIFNVFKKDRANIENDLGKGYYFTNTEDDAQVNYAGEGPDLTNRIERLAEQLEENEEFSREDAISKAKEILSGGEQRIINAYLKLDNPFVIGSSNETFLDYNEGYDPETEEYGEPSGRLLDFIEKFKDIASEYDGATPEEGVQKLLEAAIDYNGLNASEIIKILKEDGSGVVYASDFNGDVASSEIIRRTIEDAGFDGIIDTLVNQKFGTQKKFGKSMDGMGQGTVHTIAFNSNQIKSSSPVTYDDAGDVIPLSQRFRPTSPDIRRMAAEPAPKRRKEQVGGAEREETRYITTPKGILSMNTDVLREKFFDGTSVSPEKTTQAWGYISRLLDIKSGNANELAGEINDTVDADLLAKREVAIAAGEQVDPEEDVSKRIGAAMFSVELMNYAGRLAEQGDTRMLKFMIRNVNSMPTDKYAGDISDAARALRTRLEYDVSGFSAYTTEQKAKVDRTAAVMFGTNKPSKEQSDAVKDAIDESEKTELGNAGEVAGEVEKVEKRTKRKITDKIEKVIGKGSLKGMIQAVKDTPLEKQQERGWIERVVNDFLINAGLSPEAASTTSKLYESLIAERFAAAKQKAFEDNLKKAAPWKNYAARNSRLAKDALNKVQAAIRTGVLDPEKNTESIIAAESGWSGFTKDQYQRIVQLDSIINDPKQDDVTRREAMADLNKVISDAKLPVRFKDALGAYYVGNALMGIPTLTVNIASPIGFTVRNLMTDVSKFAFTDPARIPVAFETFMESMRSWYDQTSYAFKNQIYLNDVVEYLQGQNVLRELFDKGKKQWSEGKYAEGFVNMAVGMTQITGRVLSSLDQGAISMLENQNITRYALEALANTKGKVPKDKLKEFANMVIDTRRKTIAENIANGMSRDRAGVLADLAVKSEVISALAQYDVNPMNVLDASINDALQSVGRNKTLTIKGIEQSQKNISDEGFMSYWPIKLLEMVSAGAGREGSSMQIFAKMLYGFALVPARVFHNVAWFSPYGFIRLGVDKYKKNKGEDSPYAMSLQTEAQYKQRLTDAIAGSVAMLGLAALSSASTDEDEDKKFKIVITGNGPSATTDKQYFDSWMKKWKPYSVHIVVNGNIIPINIGRGGEALFFPIMLAGALDDWKIKQKQNLTKKEPEDLSAIAQMLGSSFFALAQRGPYAAFTKPLFDASKDGRVTEELASQAGFFGKTFIPVLGSSLARNISDLFNDPVDRSSIEGAIYANTPVVGPWLGTKALNALGQPIRADDWGDRLFKLGVPVVFSFPKETPMNELNELILKQGSGPTIPTRANAQKRFGDILTDKEFETYVREYGRVMSDKMFKSRTKLANMKPADYDDELEKYARGYSIDGIKIKGASDSAVLAVKRMRQ